MTTREIIKLLRDSATGAPHINTILDRAAFELEEAMGGADEQNEWESQEDAQPQE